MLLRGTLFHSGADDVSVDPGPVPNPGAEVRRAVLGDAHVDQPPGVQGPLAAIWREYSDAIAWGQVWTRPGLDLRTRSICTVAVLCALGESRQLATHIRGALRQGVTVEELAEIFVHVGNYAGAPRASTAVQVADAILAGSSGPD
jgi:alkylhydroperoxidase/carboxymuconolactone decarboxylase family protein YurZ